MTEDDLDHYVTIFRSRLRAQAASEYEEVAAHIEARARCAPGFVDFASFASRDGERVSIVVFDSATHHRAWRDDPEHREAQRLGRDRFYEQFDITVCRPVHRTTWRRSSET